MEMTAEINKQTNKQTRLSFRLQIASRSAEVLYKTCVYKAVIYKNSCNTAQNVGV